VLKRNPVLFSHLFGELQQSCVYLIMGTEGVPRVPLNCQGNVKKFHCVWSGHPV